MPVRIVFDDPKMRVHVCPDELRDYVVEDIRQRYGVEVKAEYPCASIHLDPGGMAFIDPDMIEFAVQGLPFTINAEHVPAALATITGERFRYVSDPEHGQLVRLYMWMDLIVMPASYLWAIQNHLSFREDDGIAKRNEIITILAKANEEVAQASAPEPSNIVPLFEDDENIH